MSYDKELPYVTSVAFTEHISNLNHSWFFQLAQSHLTTIISLPLSLLP